VKHPSRLGKYEITELIGEGAMGVVYKGFDPDIRRSVALKTIRRQLSDGSDFAATISARFRNEAQAAGRLAHPGIVGVYEYGEDDQIAYIAMEYVEGRSVASYLAAQTSFTDEDIPGMMSQLLDALDHAHRQGVWHRDIKPGNVILSRGGMLKVADFGIARIDAGGLTQVNTMIGTPAYMAPEQFLGEPVDARADLYSTGVLLYVLLTGRQPFAGSAEALMYKVVHEPPVLPSQIEGLDRPAFYDAIVTTALAKKAENRYPSARAFKDALTRAVGEPIDTTAWDKTILRAAPPPSPSTSAPPAHRSTGGGSLGSTAARQWDRAMLAEAEHTLAHYVGPMATVMVRRTARDCESPQELYARLAEQMTDPAARQAFLNQSKSVTSTGSGRPVGAASGAPASYDAAMLDQVRKLLAKEIGPIANVVVKKAAAATADRGALLTRVAEAVPDPKARARLLAELERLPWAPVAIECPLQFVSSWPPGGTFSQTQWAASASVFRGDVELFEAAATPK
jgi:serine/threonine-protein kinase